MRGPRPRHDLSKTARALLGLGLIAALLLACNAILGVSDVSPLGSDGGRRTRTDSEPEEEIDGEVDRDAAIDDSEDQNIFALGFLHACGRLPSGRVRCWGINSGGELGLGPDSGTDEAPVPVDVPGIADAISIGAGLEHTCIVHATGKVACWGGNSEGQLGDGTLEGRSAPTEVLDLEPATRVSAGALFTCALLRDTTVSCWGNNSFGQLGDDTKVSRPTPAPVKGLRDVVSIAAGYTHACAAKIDGTAVCWGANDTGQLGIGSTKDALVPAPLTLTGVAQIAPASSFSCARLRTGRVFCWGDNREGQLGSGSPNPSPNPSPIAVPSLGDATWIWTGFEHACAVRQGGGVHCWGRGEEGQLGVALLSDGGPASPVPTPTPVFDAPPSQQVFTGGDHACLVANGGRAMCWGTNTFGELGIGNTDTPILRATNMVNWP